MHANILDLLERICSSCPCLLSLRSALLSSTHSADVLHAVDCSEWLMGTFKLNVKVKAI